MRLGLHIFPDDGLGKAEADAGRVPKAIIATVQQNGDGDFRDVDQDDLDPGVPRVVLPGFHSGAGQLAELAACALVHQDLDVLFHCQITSLFASNRN
jgi:hypothetical protein